MRKIHLTQKENHQKNNQENNKLAQGVSRKWSEEVEKMMMKQVEGSWGVIYKLKFEEFEGVHAVTPSVIL